MQNYLRAKCKYIAIALLLLMLHFLNAAST